jgi:hypothetical protein
MTFQGRDGGRVGSVRGVALEWHFEDLADARVIAVARWASTVIKAPAGFVASGPAALLMRVLSQFAPRSVAAHAVARGWLACSKSDRSRRTRHS